ncbi:MAG: hypothetical protein ABFD82_20750 [Syntrophaceae bacterium]
MIRAQGLDTPTRKIFMTRGDVFIQLFTELSGEPQEVIAEMLNVLKGSMPSELHRFDEEISDTEAERLIDELMQEKKAILKWFFEGYHRFLLCHRIQQGDA